MYCITSIPGSEKDKSQITVNFKLVNILAVW